MVKQKTVPSDTQRDTRKLAGEGHVDERVRTAGSRVEGRGSSLECMNHCGLTAGGLWSSARAKAVIGRNHSSLAKTSHQAKVKVPPRLIDFRLYHCQQDDQPHATLHTYELTRPSSYFRLDTSTSEYTHHPISIDQNTMPAPTAPLKPVADDAPPTSIASPGPDNDEEFALEGMNDLPDSSAIQAPTTAQGEEMEIVDEEDRPHFPQVQNDDSSFRAQSRKIPIPPHRFSPLKSNWPQIYPPLVENLKLAVRMNVKLKAVELRNSKTSAPGALQKGEDFVKAFCLGFEVQDAIALLRLDDLYLETFELKDVKTLTGDHLSRAIASRVRIVLADSKVHIMGAFKNIQIARSSVVQLILGKPPGKVYNNLRTVSAHSYEEYQVITARHPTVS
ncbi:hypothetical protein CIB48_g5409 [Xylaria polymorpha]|nr:hypothetical protein CIB48_g5409 [Xylaria polymorpha]